MTAPASSRDAEVRDVVAQLDALLATLAANVDALSAILRPPDAAPIPDAEVPAP